MSHLTTKPMKWSVCQAKTRISLGIRPVWSVFAVPMKKHWALSYTLIAQRRFWADWVDAQTGLSRRWAQMSFCWFCHEAAKILNIASVGIILYRLQKRKTLIKLHGCAGWSVPLLFAYGIKQVLSWCGSFFIHSPVIGLVHLQHFLANKSP